MGVTITTPIADISFPIPPLLPQPPHHLIHDALAR